MSIKTKLDERKLRKQRKIKEYEELTISDDFMFYKVMQNPELCKELLEILLDVEIEKLEYISRQKVLKKTYDGKGIRLDVYTKDINNTVYNLEMQAIKIFINSKWILEKDKWENSSVTPRLISLLRYIEEGQVTDEYTQKLEVEVSKVKQDMRWRKKYMVYEKNLYYSKLEGQEEGIVIGEERTAELYVKLIDDERFEDARRAKEDLEYLHQLLKEYNLI